MADVADVIYVSSDEESDKPIYISDDEDDEDDEVPIEYYDDDDDDDDDDMDIEEDVGPLLVEVAMAGHTQQFSLPNGRDLPLCLLYTNGIETMGSMLLTPRESLTTVSAQAHWDAAFLACLLMDMPVPDCMINMQIFLDGCACLRKRENPAFTITLK